MAKQSGLRVSGDLELPLAIVTQTQVILAKKGAGKTYTAAVEIEEALKLKQPVVVLDPTGAWWGLKSSADGLHPGFPIAIFGGEHADIPLEESAGEVVATAIVERQFSAVIDLSLFRKGQMHRFLVPFLETLYRINRHSLMLVVDEADFAAPQKPFGEEARTLGAMQDIVRRGRIRGLGRSMNSVYRLARKLDLSKNPECVREQIRAISLRPDHGGRAFQFKKGHVPQNKGKKMPKGWAPGRMRETQFKKGNATNWMPVGSTRLIDGYTYRKTSDIRNVPHTRNWRPEHYLLWEKKRGPIPAGHAVVFKDGNREHIKLSNLELITRAELMLRNTIHNLPKKLVQVIMLNGALKRKIRRRLRDAEEQNERSQRPPVRNSRRAA